MIGLDTGILVRYVTRDHATLFPLALEIISNHACFVSREAMMEMVFALESVYRKDRDEVAKALRAIVGLITATVESPGSTGRAIAWYEQGMDFGDAMILASSADAEKLASFDRDFQRLATRIGAAPRVEYFRA